MPSECPKCGGDEFVVRLKVSGIIEEAHRFDRDDIRVFNGDMWNPVRLDQRKRAHCRDCGAFVGLTADLLAPSNPIQGGE
jgi:hypothetical protein